MSAAEPGPRTAEAASAFAALGDVTRLQLVSRLSHGQPRSIAQLCDGLELTRQGVSKHLGVLERAGLVVGRRVGRERRYVFDPDGLERARTYLDRVSEQWDDAILRLKRFVED